MKACLGVWKIWWYILVSQAEGEPLWGSARYKSVIKIFLTHNYVQYASYICQRLYTSHMCGQGLLPPVIYFVQLARIFVYLL